MRVNIYAEEMTERIEIIEKVIEGTPFTGLRLYLELPVSVPPYIATASNITFVPDADHTLRVPTADDVQNVHIKGPFKHHPGDDDSAAVTFWGKRDLRAVLKLMLAKLDAHYDAREYARLEEQVPAPTMNIPCCRLDARGSWEGMVFMCINHDPRKFWLFQDFHGPAIAYDNVTRKPLP